MAESAKLLQDHVVGCMPQVKRLPSSVGSNVDAQLFIGKENLFEGNWRVDVKTERNQIIGRVRFNIKTKLSEVELKEEIL